MSARRAALSALLAIEQGKAYSSAAVKKAVKDFGLTDADAGLCHQIVFGVLQHKLYLDFLINQYSKVKTRKMEIKVLEIIRLSVFQLLFLDRVPSYAVIDEAVTLTRKNAKNPKAAGLVNAVLRSIEREKAALPRAEDVATRYSHPRELVDRWIEELGEERTVQILQANNQTAPVYMQPNLLYTSSEQILSLLSESGYSCENSEFGIGLRDPGNLERLPAFQEGLCYVQDPAARKAAAFADAQPGMQVLDLCAAPGGKSFSIAMDMNDNGKIISCDVHPHKIELITSGAKRLKLDCIEPTLSDATVFRPDWAEQFDLVFADVPCSGFGTIRKRPEIRYKKLEDLCGLPEIQGKILANAFSYVKPGGTVVYSTCTLFRAENEAVVEQQLARCDHMVLEKMETLYPCDGDWDGFFMAKMRKNG